ncbi:MAG: SPOR domain-containing protein [Methylophilaceae bacterium]
MSKDYKQASDRPAKKKGSSFLTGLLFGILFGVGASLAVVMYLKGDNSPFKMQSSKETNQSLADKIASDAKTQTAPAEVVTPVTPPSTNNPPADTAESKDDNRFDYYDILPKNGEDAKDSIKVKPDAPAAVTKTYYLQVGSFQTQEEADNLKAKLALQGFEAIIQTADIADKGTWHRVRVGPFNDLDQISKTKESLMSNGFSADLIKVNNA